MKKLIIKDTEDAKREESKHGLKFIGQELKNPYFFGRSVTGIVERPSVIPMVYIPIWVILERDSIVEVESRPLKEVIAEAKERSL